MKAKSRTPFPEVVAAGGRARRRERTPGNGPRALRPKQLIDPNDEIQAGATIAEGYQVLHEALCGLPTTLVLILTAARRKKLSSILERDSGEKAPALQHKLFLLRDLLSEWKDRGEDGAAPLPVLRERARAILRHTQFTRPFLLDAVETLKAACASRESLLRDQERQETFAAIAHGLRKIQEGRDRLVVSHLWLVDVLAARCRRYVQDSDMGDLIQDGALALLHVAELFDLRRKAGFRTYAPFWIRQAMGRCLDAQGHIVSIPSHLLVKARAAARRARALEQSLGRAASPEEIAATLGIPVGTFARIQAASALDLSLESPVADDLTMGDLLMDPHAGAFIEQVENEDTEEDTAGALSQPDGRPARVPSTDTPASTRPRQRSGVGAVRKE